MQSAIGKQHPQEPMRRTASDKALTFALTAWYIITAVFGVLLHGQLGWHPLANLPGCFLEHRRGPTTWQQSFRERTLGASALGRTPLAESSRLEVDRSGSRTADGLPSDLQRGPSGERHSASECVLCQFQVQPRVTVDGLPNVAAVNSTWQPPCQMPVNAALRVVHPWQSRAPPLV